jgi:23S rRNA (cytosine1962-C5)-methyltransferase
MNKLILKTGREKSLKRRHPWIFSGAVSKIVGNPVAGETIEIQSSDGEFLAVAAYSPQSQIVARVWDWHKREIDAAYFRMRITRAVESRKDIALVSNACRLIYGEADGLPGVIVDRYADTLVLQLLTTGAQHWRATITEVLREVTCATAIFERSDADVVALEGMAPQVGWLYGAASNATSTIAEHGLSFALDFEHGHKTGFYLDQRDNRRYLRNLVKDKDVLDCFCYSGGFTVNARAGGARSVTAIDSSADALAMLKRNLELNNLPVAEVVEADVFQYLRKLRDVERRFDLIILDPPKFAPTAHHAEKATRAYKDINLLAFKLLKAGGHLVTFSCSGGVSRDLFQKVVAGAALDAGVEAQIVAQLSAGVDHPIALNFPESEYLKGLVVRVV